MTIKHDYFYGGEAEQFAFYRMPRQLFTNDHYRFISTEAITLSINISRKNRQDGWDG